MSEDKTTELLKLPERDYISSYTFAHATVNEALLSYDDYHKLIRQCMSHMAGEKPVKPEKLKKAGMNWASNWNYGKARGKTEKVVAENVSKIASALALTVPRFRSGKKSDDTNKISAFLNKPDEKIFVSDALIFAFIETLEQEEKRFYSLIQKIESCSYPYGIGTVLYEPHDWLGRAVHNLRISFEPDTDPDDIKMWVEMDEISAKDLWQKWVKARNEEIRQEEDPDRRKLKRAKSGWVVNALQEVLVRAFKGKLEGNETEPNWERILPIYEKSPQTAIQSTESVKIAKINYRELDGTFSKTYIPYGNTWDSKEAGANSDKQASDASSVDMIIYRKNFGDYVQNDHINIIRDNLFTEEGAIQEFRGAAKFYVEDSIRYNRTRNQLNNKMHFTGSPMFQQPNTQTGEKFKLTVSQGFILLPAGTPPMEKQPSFDIGSHISVLKFEEGEHLRDTVQYDAKLEGRLTSRPTKDEVRQTSGEIKQASLSKDNVKIKDYANVFYNMMRRLATIKGLKKSDRGYEGVKRFKELVKEYIHFVETDADVKKLVSLVKSLHVEIVNGDMDALQLGASLSETSYGRQRFKRMMLISSGFSYTDARIAVPLQFDKAAGLTEERIVRFENNLFWQTNDVPIVDSDDDITHLIGHIAKAIRCIEGVKTGQLEPVKGFTWLSNGMPHAAQHMIALEQQGMKGPQFEQLTLQFEQINSQLPAIKAAAQQQLQAEQEEREQQVLGRKEIEELKIKSLESQEKMRRSQEQSDLRGELKAQGQQFNQALAAQQQSFDQQMEVMKARMEELTQTRKQNG